MSSLNNMTSTSGPQLGTTGLKPFLGVATLPEIFFEWASILPLVIYLASSTLSHQLVGKASLAGKLYLGIFPKLGVLRHAAELLREGSDYIDRACSISELKREVWDANFGSTFPCANGAASSMITSYFINNSKPVSVESDLDACGPTSSIKNLATATAELEFRRYQSLHVFRCTRAQINQSLIDRLLHIHLLPSTQVIFVFLLLGFSVIASLFGLLGTAASILISAVVQLCSLVVQIQRPSGFLESNGSRSACMLTSLNNNATSWYLFTGDRGVVDGLLNKTIIFAVAGKYGRASTKALALIFWVLEILQLLAMTFVTAQKGWDGVGLLVLIIVGWSWELLVNSDTAVVRKWIKENTVEILSTSLSFSGRTAMLGAIQVWKQNPIEVWMDTILPQSLRRRVWLSHLAGTNTSAEMVAMAANLDASEKAWVSGNLSRTNEAIKIWKQKSFATENSIAQYPVESDTHLRLLWPLFQSEVNSVPASTSCRLS